MGNVELFELCETNPQTQCTECILYWSQGIILSIQNYVIKKGRPHGHRYGKTKEQRDHHIAHNLKKRFIKRNVEGTHDRFLKDPDFRESQLEHDRTEEVCMDKDARVLGGFGVLVFKVDDILEGQKGDQGNWRRPQNGQNSIWGKTGRL